MAALLERIGKIRRFTVEVQGEMKKVTWPDWQQLRNATGVIIIFVLVVAAIIGLMDLVFRKLIGFIIGIFGA